MKDKEKEIKYLMYLENEKIRLSKKKLKLYKEQLENLKGKGRILKKGKEYGRGAFND